MRHTPYNDGSKGDNADEPLHPGELVLNRPDRYDGCASAGTEADEEGDPDEED